SGTGGLSVAHALRVQLPDADIIYAADTAGFPYGKWAEVLLVRRILRVMRDLLDLVRPDCVVIGCNTASTLALDVLREEFRVPFVGTVPAIKPAAAQTKTGVIGVLATPGTARREYTKTLIHTYAFHCRVMLHGAPRLAEIAETKLAGAKVDREELLAEIKPVFRRKGGAPADVVVLGCTHYPLLLDEMKEVAPWPVAWIDPAPAIARRTASILSDGDKADSGPLSITRDTVILTSQPPGGHHLPAGFASAGFDKLHIADIPL
ncbi:MAG: glutamate racemase, partial [Pseudomonadota bacterium]